MLPSFVSAGIVDSNIYPRPASPPTFGTDHKAIDPIFGTTLLRVTGPVGSNAIRESDAENQNIAPVQHFHNPWNITGDMFVVWEDRLSHGSGAGTTLYAINNMDFTVTRVGRIGTSAPQVNYNRGIKWSTNPVLPDSDNKYLLYAVDSTVTPNAIKRWNVDTEAAHDGLAAGSSEIVVTDPAGIMQLTVSGDCDKFNYWTNASVVKVYVESTGTTYSKDCSSWIGYNGGPGFDESEIVDSGGYVEIKGH